MTTNVETAVPESDQDVPVPAPRRDGQGERWIDRLGWEETD